MIFHQSINQIIPSAAVPSSGRGHGQCCPSGWKEFDSHCYKGFTLQPLPFFSVAKACQKYDAHFVDIHSKAEYQFVKSEWDLNKYWIGVISYSDGHHQNQVIWEQIILREVGASHFPAYFHRMAAPPNSKVLMTPSGMPKSRIHTFAR
jgi:hypothetical protein